MLLDAVLHQVAVCKLLAADSALTYGKDAVLTVALQVCVGDLLLTLWVWALHFYCGYHSSDELPLAKNKRCKLAKWALVLLPLNQVGAVIAEGVAAAIRLDSIPGELQAHRTVQVLNRIHQNKILVIIMKAVTILRDRMRKLQFECG